MSVLITCVYYVYVCKAYYDTKCDKYWRDVDGDINFDDFSGCDNALLSPGFMRREEVDREAKKTTITFLAECPNAHKRVGFIHREVKNFEFDETAPVVNIGRNKIYNRDIELLQIGVGADAQILIDRREGAQV